MTCSASAADHRTVLITGASRGIGAETARAFAGRGWTLLLLARNGHALEALADELRDVAAAVHWASVDLVDPVAIAPGVADLTRRGGTPSVLINNAGAAYTGGLASMPLEDWQWLLQLNLTSIFQVTQALLAPMRQAGGGLIINVGSHAAGKAFPGWGAYGISKAGLAAFSQYLAAEEAPHGIRVTTLTLGAVDTPLWDTRTVQADFDRHAMLRPTQVAAALLQLAEHPTQQLVEQLTLMPTAGAL